nr:DUF2793 domain-containing protein [uncultured Cohaesibacter sp.]
MEQTTNLALPYIVGNQNQKHITHNEALRMLDALVQLSVADRDLTAPPDEPSDGARYIVADGASDAWNGWDGSIAAYLDGAWTELQPLAGWLAWLEDESKLLCFDGTDWSDFIISGVGSALANGSFDKLGINATADATNRLALSAGASLFNHAGNGHQIKVNKAAASDTNSLLFQTNWSGRAEMGCTGDDDWSVKVSADGSTWTTALQVDASSGLLSATNWVGSVSNTGVGAILESGSNANGTYVRFADGLQICTSLVTSSDSTFIIWTYPAEFSGAAENVMMTARGLTPYHAQPNGSGSASTIAVNCWDLDGNRVETDVTVFAIGRWV